MREQIEIENEIEIEGEIEIENEIEGEVDGRILAIPKIT